MKISNDFLQNPIIMSYGPQLPPHLMKSKRATDSDADSDEGQDVLGPKLPSQPCLGPRPPTNIGPQLPNTNTQNDIDESSDEDDEAYGPRLPSQPCFGPRPPQRSNDVIGPQIPTSFQSSSSRKDDNNEESSDEDEMIGPMPPKPGEEVSTEDYHKRNFEERASRMQDKLEGKNKVQEPKREDW